jgi:hypothetical protein
MIPRIKNRNEHRVQFHPLACGRVGLSGPGRALCVTLSAAETATLPVGESRNSPLTEDVGFQLSIRGTSTSRLRQQIVEYACRVDIGETFVSAVVVPG